MRTWAKVVATKTDEGPPFRESEGGELAAWWRGAGMETDTWIAYQVSMWMQGDAVDAHLGRRLWGKKSGLVRSQDRTPYHLLPSPWTSSSPVGRHHPLRSPSLLIYIWFRNINLVFFFWHFQCLNLKNAHKNALILEGFIGIQRLSVYENIKRYFLPAPPEIWKVISYFTFSYYLKFHFSWNL